MIEFIVLVILIIIFLLLLFLLFSAAIVFIVNIVLLILIVPQLIHDIKKRDFYIFYLLSIVITAIMFIAHNYLSWLFDFFNKVYVLPFVQALLLIFITAHILALLYFAIEDMKRKPKKS